MDADPLHGIDLPALCDRMLLRAVIDAAAGQEDASQWLAGADAALPVSVALAQSSDFHSSEHAETVCRQTVTRQLVRASRGDRRAVSWLEGAPVSIPLTFACRRLGLDPVALRRAVSTRFAL